MTDKKKLTGKAAIKGILNGVSEIVEKLDQLGNAGETFEHSSEFQTEGSGQKGIFGISVKVGLGGGETRVEPFGNIRKDRATGESVVQEVREPIVDLFEEADHLLMVAEMPGIGAQDVTTEFHEDVLTVAAERGEKRYRKEILLPRPVDPTRMTLGCNNGILEMRLPYRQTGPSRTGEAPN